jgi:hypothetical protein
MQMKRIKRASIVLIAVGLIVSLTMVIPASAKTSTGGVEVLSSEFVVATMASSGQIEEVQVFNQLSLNGDGTVTVKEEKAFDDVGGYQAVKSFTKPSVEGNYIVWPEIQVDGPTSVIAATKLSEPMVEEARMRIPLGVRFKYWFEGEPVTDLETVTGKSGRFKMELTLTNESKEKTEIEYKDAATGKMVTEEVETYLPMVILPYDWYFDNSIFFNLKADPTGLVVPMPDFFNVGWSIPLFPPATEESHTIWVTADTKNFQMPPLTLAVAFEFPETNQTDPLSILSQYIKAFYDGMVAVNEGIGSPTTDPSLLYGINAIYDGLQQMGAGLPAAPQAINEQLKPGVDEMAAGIADSLPLVGSTVNDPDTLLYAANAVLSNLQTISGYLGSATTEGSLIYGAYSVMNGLSNTDPANPGLLQGLELISMGLGLVEGSLNANVSALGGVYAELADAGIGSGTIRDLVDSSPTMAAMEKVALNNVMDAVAADVQAVIDSITAPYPFGSIALVQAIKDNIDAEALPGVQQMYDGLTLIYGGLVAIQSGLGSTTTGDSLLYASAAIEEGLISLRAALSTGNPSDPGLYEGLVQVSGGLTELATALDEAVAGIGSAGTPDTLLYGADQVNSGLAQLQVEGTMALEEGLAAVLDNFSMTNSELEAIALRGEEFDHFLGRAEGADNQVRFVYQSNPTYNYKTGNSTSWIVAIVLSIIIALGLVAGGILLARKSSA